MAGAVIGKGGHNIQKLRTEVCIDDFTNKHHCHRHWCLYRFSSVLDLLSLWFSFDEEKKILSISCHSQQSQNKTEKKT
jgi:hypothetical protein